jgi:hypothetical protein
MSHMIPRLILLAALAFASGSCSSSTPASKGSASTMLTTYYDPGTQVFPKESGLVLVGSDGQPTGIKNGRWITWYPPAQGNGKQFEKTYVADAWDENQYWREWNEDTSLRFDWQDR